MYFNFILIIIVIHLIFTYIIVFNIQFTIQKS